jgi:anti-anti-sigma factor
VRTAWTETPAPSLLGPNLRPEKWVEVGDVVTLNLVCGNECVEPHALCIVEGEVDLATAGEFRRAAVLAMDEHGPALTLDLSHVSFMDCAGLSALVLVRKQATARGGHVTLTGPPDVVSRLLRLVGLDTVFGLQALTPLISLPA